MFRPVFLLHSGQIAAFFITIGASTCDIKKEGALLFTSNSQLFVPRTEESEDDGRFAPRNVRNGLNWTAADRRGLCLEYENRYATQALRLPSLLYGIKLLCYRNCVMLRAAGWAGQKQFRPTRSAS
jgi:hypothetical protein